MLLPWRSTCNIYVILKPIQRWTANDSFWRQCLFKKTKALDIRFSSLQAGYEVPDVHILCEDPKVPAGLSPSPKTHTGPNCNLWSTKCCFFKLACVPQKGEPLGFDSSSSQGLFPAFFQSVFSVFQYAPISLSSVLHYFNKLYRGHWRLAPGDRHAVLCHVVRSGTLRPVECPVVGQWAGLLWFSPFPQTMVFSTVCFLPNWCNVWGAERFAWTRRDRNWFQMAQGQIVDNGLLKLPKDCLEEFEQESTLESWRIPHLSEVVALMQFLIEFHFGVLCPFQCQSIMSRPCLPGTERSRDDFHCSKLGKVSRLP